MEINEFLVKAKINTYAGTDDTGKMFYPTAPKSWSTRRMAGHTAIATLGSIRSLAKRLFQRMDWLSGA